MQGDFESGGATLALEDNGLKKELRAGERVLWSGRPFPARVMLSTFAIWFFAIPWTAFALFWETMALSPWFAESGSRGAPKAFEFGFAIVFPLFGLPFVLIGLGMMAAPFYAYRKAQRTVFAITSERALIMDGGARGEVKTFPLAQMSGEVRKSVRSDGSGSLYFSFQKRIDGDGDRVTDRKGFECVADVNEVERKLQQAVASFHARREAAEQA